MFFDVVCVKVGWHEGIGNSGERGNGDDDNGNTVSCDLVSLW